MLASFLKRDPKNLIQKDASLNFQVQNDLLSLHSRWRSVRSLRSSRSFFRGQEIYPRDRGRWETGLRRGSDRGGFVITGSLSLGEGWGEGPSATASLLKPSAHWEAKGSALAMVPGVEPFDLRGGDVTCRPSPQPSPEGEGASFSGHRRPLF